MLGMAARIPWSVPAGPGLRFPELAALTRTELFLEPPGLRSSRECGTRGGGRARQREGRMAAKRPHCTDPSALHTFPSPPSCQSQEDCSDLLCSVLAVWMSPAAACLHWQLPPLYQLPCPARPPLLLPYPSLAFSNSSRWKRLCQRQLPRLGITLKISVSTHYTRKHQW